MVSLTLLILLLLAVHALLDPLLELTTWLLTPTWFLAPLLLALGWVLAAPVGQPRHRTEGSLQNPGREAG